MKGAASLAWQQVLVEPLGGVDPQRQYLAEVALPAGLPTCQLALNVVIICPAGGKILLNNARLHLKRGKRYGLCGPNGAGKSTLMRAISNGQLDGFPPKEELRTVRAPSHAPCSGWRVPLKGNVEGFSLWLPCLAKRPAEPWVPPVCIVTGCSLLLGLGAVSLACILPFVVVELLRLCLMLCQ